MELNLDSEKEGVTVITCTNKPLFMKNVMRNFMKQKWINKEHIIILNNDSMNQSEWEGFAKKQRNVTIYKLSEKMSLGACLNFAIKKAKYNFIAKFDDDDYYGPFYLAEAMQAFRECDADVVGKRTFFIYFPINRLLMLRFPHSEMQWTKYVAGGTIIARKKVFDEVVFKDLAAGTDRQFLLDCQQKNFKIYSTSRYNYAYLRRRGSLHTWKAKRSYLIRTSEKIAITKYYKKYVNAKHIDI